ncbi:MAG: dockerin type I repeat-containing protein [Muribaculaceae bacterium]|nr:dockerin type I repeat-containing protein [Muribaculaceae bacterium]
MRKLFTFFGLMALTVCPLLAQDIDENFVFVDENMQLIENGATVVRNVVEVQEDGTEIINSGISVFDMGAPADVYLKMKYTVVQIDNGAYQLCFPMSCNMQTTTGMYETGYGQVMGGLQNIQSEWFPTADGVCEVVLSIETFVKGIGWPATYTHLGYGPSITLKFVKGGAPEPIKGDVNGDGEVNISDVNAVIDAILSSSSGNEAADVNKDGEVNISDINAVIDIILNP